MNTDTKGRQLIAHLLSDPEGFSETDGPNDLLREYIGGFPLETLRPLLTHSSPVVRTNAMFVANELGIGAQELIHEIIPLIDDAILYTKWDALESVTVCAVGRYVNEFVFVLKGLEEEHAGIRQLTMRLMARVDESRLRAAAKLAERIGSSAVIHRMGLESLLLGPSLGESGVKRMRDDGRPLIRKYAAIAAERCFRVMPAWLEYMMQSTDSDVSTFAQEALEWHKEFPK